MKVECSAEKLKEGLSNAERITGKNLTLPVLGSILILARGKSLTLRATNLSLGVEIEIPAKIEKEGIVAINGALLTQLFSALNDGGNVSISSDGQAVSIRSSRSDFTLKASPHDDFPTIPVIEGDEIVVSSKKLIDGARSVSYSSSISEIKPEIASVYIYPNNDSLIFVATDSFRLAEKRIKQKVEKDFDGILIPYKNMNEIIKIIHENTGDVSIVFNKNQVAFKAPGLYLTSRAIDGVFPDYKQIIPNDFKTEAIVLKQDLLNALKISNIFSDKFNQVTLSLSPKKKEFILTSKNADIGEHTTRLEGSFKGDDVEISFNYKYFIDCFQSISADSIKIECNQSNKPIVISGVGDASFLYMVMPMNR